MNQALSRKLIAAALRVSRSRADLIRLHLMLRASGHTRAAKQLADDAELLRRVCLDLDHFADMLS